MCGFYIMYFLAVLPLILLVVDASDEYRNVSAFEGLKCVIPNGVDHVTRTALLQQCISKNYGIGNETQCWTELGCFEMKRPWISQLRPFPTPLPPPVVDTRLYCYTRAAPEKRYNVTLWPSISLEGCPFNDSKWTVFITHGFSSDGNASWLSEMKDNYFEQMDANIFLVDWGPGAQFINYLQVASNTRIVGAELARFIKFLRTKGLSPSKLHLIGHSLGAHISSYAAKATKDPNVARITALDPAQPGFDGTDEVVRLDKSDADYVEVLHTNAAPFIPTLGFGMIPPRGHVDFYVNGGARQPGCILPDATKIKSISDLASIPVEILSNLVSCSHGRSHQIYKEVLKKNCFVWGRQASIPRHLASAVTLGYTEVVVSIFDGPCTPDKCIPITLHTPLLQARGVFAASTSNDPPFCETDPVKNRKLFTEILEEESNKSSPSTSIGKVVSSVKTGIPGLKKGVKSIFGY